MYDSKIRIKHLDSQYVLRLPKEMLERLKVASENANKPISQIIRTAIKEYLKGSKK